MLILLRLQTVILRYAIYPLFFRSREFPAYIGFFPFPALLDAEGEAKVEWENPDLLFALIV